MCAVGNETTPSNSDAVQTFVPPLRPPLPQSSSLDVLAASQRLEPDSALCPRTNQYLRNGRSVGLAVHERQVHYMVIVRELVVRVLTPASLSGSRGKVKPLRGVGRTKVRRQVERTVARRRGERRDVSVKLPTRIVGLKLHRIAPRERREKGGGV